MLVPILPRYLLMALLPPAAIGVELGAFRGEFSNMLLRNAKPALLHLVDSWHFPAAPMPTAGDITHANVLRRFAPEIRQNRVVVHRAAAADVLGAMDDETLDFVYIGGEHGYDAMLQNLRLAHRKVKPGGLICGTNYTAVPDDAARAVHDFLVENKSACLVALLLEEEYAIRRINPKMMETRAERKVQRTTRKKKRKVKEK